MASFAEPELSNISTTINRGWRLASATAGTEMLVKLLTKPVNQITTNPRNARTHDNKQIHKLAASIQAFGFWNPVLVDETGMIIAGHGRLAAALELRLTEVPVIVVEGLSEAEKRGLALADRPAKRSFVGCFRFERLIELVRLRKVSLHTLPLGNGLARHFREQREGSLCLPDCAD
jgi:hypothetical protein